MTTGRSVRRRVYQRVVTDKSHTVSEARALEGNVVTAGTIRKWIKKGPEYCNKRNRSCKMTEDHFQVLLHWLHKEPRRTYQQSADYVYAKTQHAYTIKQIRGAFKKRKISRKKIDPVAFQRDEVLRRNFRRRLMPPHLGTLLFFLLPVHA